MKTYYYLAYGSNLNIDQMSRRCHDSKKVGTATINGYRLLFKGAPERSFLTIEKDETRNVPVGVWEVSEDDIRYLDMYEGYPTFYYKKDLEITYEDIDGSSKTVNSFVYIMHESNRIGMPTKQYMKTCLQGYKDFSFDRKYLDEALEISKKG